MSKVRKTLIQNGFLRLPEVRLLKKLYGGDGVLAAIACYLAMTDSSEGWLDKDTIICEAETEGVKKVDAWLEFVTQKNIITCTNGRYTNTHVDRDRKSYKAKLEREQNRYKDEAEKRQKNKESEAEPVYVYDNDLDLDNKIILPAQWDTPEMREAVSRWKGKLKTVNRRYDQFQFDAQMMQFAGNIQRFIAAVNHSCAMSKTYNLHEPKPEFNKQTTAEKIKEMGAKLI